MKNILIDAASLQLQVSESFLVNIEEEYLICVPNG